MHITRRQALVRLAALGLAGPAAALLGPREAAAQWPPIWFWDSSPKAGLQRDAVGLWLFENSSSLGVDSSSKGNSLTNNNTVTQVAGKIGSAAQFVAASSQSLSKASNATLQTGSIDFTVAAWVQLTTKPSAAGLVTKWTGGASPREYTLEYDGGGTDRFNFTVRNAADSGAVGVNADAFGSPSTGVWYFVVGYHQAGVGIGISVNGGAVNTTATTAGVNTAAAAFILGAYANGTYHNGLLDQVLLIKRLLTPTEIAWLAAGHSLA